MFDKMSVRRQALNVQSGDKKYIDGACVLANADGDKSFRLLARAISKVTARYELRHARYCSRHWQIC